MERTPKGGIENPRDFVMSSIKTHMLNDSYDEMS